MTTPNPLQHAAPLLRHPLRFAWEALKEFRANQGLLLAGAVAYYALLSIVPLLIVSVIALSQVNVVYGSLTTAIVVLLSLEIAATLVLLGAQVIAQYERLDRTGTTRVPESGRLSGEPVESLRPGGSPRR